VSMQKRKRSMALAIVGTDVALSVLANTLIT